MEYKPRPSQQSTYDGTFNNDTRIDNATLRTSTVPAFFSEFEGNNDPDTVFVIRGPDKNNYVVAKAIDNETTNEIIILCTDQSGFNNIMNTKLLKTSEKQQNEPQYTYKIFKFPNETNITYGTVRATDFNKIVETKDLFKFVEGTGRTMEEARASRDKKELIMWKLRKYKMENPQTPVQSLTAQQIIEKFGPLATVVVALLLTLYSMSNQKGGGVDSNPQSDLSKEELEELLKKLQPEVNKNDLNTEISNLDTSDKEAVKKEIKEYFPGFNLEEGETVFGSLTSLFSKGGKRRRTNKKRRTNKRRNNKKKSNRR